jgi:alpha-aminoadipic semialdehyde synthase
VADGFTKTMNTERCVSRCAFWDERFLTHIKAGATIVTSEALRTSHIVLGIKEPPVNEVYPYTNGVTHFMFSHTAKGQSYNTPLLARFVNPWQKPPRLIDYELLTDENGKRTVGFGWFAGG